MVLTLTSQEAETIMCAGSWSEIGLRLSPWMALAVVCDVYGA
jgi:hypothetical protein